MFEKNHGLKIELKQNFFIYCMYFTILKPYPYCCYFSSTVSIRSRTSFDITANFEIHPKKSELFRYFLDECLV
jgi:hypothetical protein